MDNALTEAREMLRDVTPLKTDCGRVCGAACCSSMEGEETGMLLFPGEEERYEGRAGWRVIPSETGRLVICPGTCDREDRPLSCRIFPLLPVLRNGGIRAVTDLRAKAVCPLARQGRSAMDPDFTEAVVRVGECLLRSKTQRLFLEKLTEIQEEWETVRKQLGGDGHV